MRFVITLDQASGLDIGLTYQTMDVTTVAGQDYVAAAGQVTVTAGTLTTTVSVNLVDDSRHELPEHFVLTLSNPVNTILVDAQGDGTILDDDPIPFLAVSDVALAEGDAGTQTAFFTVTLTHALAAGFTVDYATQDGTAIAGADYAASSGRLAFNGDDGERQTIAVTINSDTSVEPDETFTMTLSNVNAGSYTVTVAANGVGTIRNDDLPPNLPPLAINDAITTTEGVTVTVAVLTNDSDPDNDPLTIVGVGSPSSGSVSHDGSHITYTPVPDLVTSVNFTYTIADAVGQRATALVTVAMIDHLPQGTDLALTVQNDADADGLYSRQEEAALTAPVTQRMAANVNAFGDLVVPVQVVLTNLGDEVLTVTAITDTLAALPGSTCGAWPGLPLDSGATATCLFTVTLTGDDHLTVNEQLRWRSLTMRAI
ncbi:MAG: Calx-beta domain-containing protein [Caldilineaceae bacterium]